MFIVGTKASQGDPWTENVLIPPSGVEYPPRRNIMINETVDGNIVIQRPLRDGRSRKWLWHMLPLKSAAYNAQWDLLLTFDYRCRAEAGLYPFVGVWEDETGSGGFERMDGASRLFTRVKIVQVSRTAEPHYYPETQIEFYISDPTHTGF